MDYFNRIQTAVASSFMDVETVLQFAAINFGMEFATDAVSNAIPYGGYARTATMQAMRACGDVAKLTLWNYVQNSTKPTAN